MCKTIFSGVLQEDVVFFFGRSAKSACICECLQVLIHISFTYMEWNLPEELHHISPDCYIKAQLLMRIFQTHLSAGDLLSVL